MKMRIAIPLSLVLMGITLSMRPRTETTDAEVIRQLFDAALTRGRCYNDLRVLCKDVGARLSGSTEAAKAVEWGAKTLREIRADSVWLQPVMVPHWERGYYESGRIRSGGKTYDLNITALGGSVGTGPHGLSGEVIELTSLKQCEEMDPAEIAGKIVFFNRPMEPTHLNTFHAYGGCVDQRSSGAVAAAKAGAKAVIIRSMNLRDDEFAHTGAMRYQNGTDSIPAAALSTRDADLLHSLLEKDGGLSFELKLGCTWYEDAPSFNVIGEIRGSEKPDEIVLVGGHLDSWDVGEGAHDDGAGCVHSMEVLHLFRVLDLKPKRTIRCVLFMNEENGMRGALKYADEAAKHPSKHIAAIESDRGGFTPRGFSIDGSEGQLAYIRKWSGLLEPFLLRELEAGYGGVDINPLKTQGTLLLGFVPDSQRYFDYHHSDHDVFEEVNKRELELGAASMAAMVWLLSEHGVPGR